MAGAVAPLSSAEIADIQRFCGYPTLASLSFATVTLQAGYIAMSTILASLGVDQITVVRTVYLANLYLLESDIPGVRANSDTEQAAVWHRNPMELQERLQLLSNWRLQLCFFLGVPVGQGIYPYVPGVFTTSPQGSNIA
jgi:hypothetical protein